MPAELVDLESTTSYQKFLDEFLARQGKAGSTEVVLKLGSAQSAVLKFSNQHLYFTDYTATGAGKAVTRPVPESYIHMAEPDTVGRPSIENALFDSKKRWLPAPPEGVDWKKKEQQTRIIIFIVAEAARFEIVREAVRRMVEMHHNFNYRAFREILHNYEKARTSLNKAVSNAELVKVLKDNPKWENAEAEGYLTTLTLWP